MARGVWVHEGVSRPRKLAVHGGYKQRTQHVPPVHSVVPPIHERE